MYRIDVHARLLILRKKSPLQGLILVCTFINFEKKFPPACLFHPARLLLLAWSKFHSTHDPVWSCPKYSKALPNQSQSNPKVFQNIPKYPKVSMARNCPPPPQKKKSPCTVLFWSARLLVVRKFLPLHVYSALHNYCFLRIFPPARLFRPVCLFGTLNRVLTNFRNSSLSHNYI